MATTPKELLRGFMEPGAPPSSSVFLNLHGDGDGDGDGDGALHLQSHGDLTLDYISRMLMEEDMIDDFLYRQYPDHPVILQAQQPFAQILSVSGIGTTSYGATLLPSQGNNTDPMAPGFLAGGEEDQAIFLNGTNISLGMLSSMAFFKGMEEATRFLPRDDGATFKNRFYESTEVDVSRSSKQTAAPVQPDLEEEATAADMLNRLMLNGFDRCPGESQELRVSVDTAEQHGICRKAPRGRRGAARQPVVADLETMLIRCAEAVASNDRRSARKLLELIKWHSSPTGDATQRLAHYFAEGLEARLAGTGSQLYRSLMAKRTSVVALLKAYQLYTVASCFIKVAFLFSNKTIYNAVAGRKRLHIVNYGANDGFQWPELLRWLADREGGPPEVRITNINSPQPVLPPAHRIEQAGRRLSHCASQFGVPFKFRAITAKAESVHVEDLDIDPDEVLAVNSLFHFRTLMDESVAVDRTNPRDQVLGTIKKMKPSVFIHAIANGSYSMAFFVTRFREALYNYAAQFDMMEATVPRDDGRRLLVERDIFALGAMNIIACEGVDRVERAENYRQWQARNQRAGLRQLPLDPDVVRVVKGKVKQYHKHFVINEDHRWLLQGWKGRVLYALSTWAADDASGSSIS